jgi:hypothetical protein
LYQLLPEALEQEHRTVLDRLNAGAMPGTQSATAGAQEGRVGDQLTEQLPPEGARFSEEDAPAAFREGGNPDGEVLTAPYLARTPEWDLRGSYITNHYGAGKPLTTYIKVGRARAYLFKEVAALRFSKTAIQSKREEKQPKREKAD